MIIKIDPGGSIALPQSVLDDLGVGPGDSIEYELIGDTLKLLRRTADSSQPDKSED